MVANPRIGQAYKVLQSIIDAECGSILYRFMKCTTVDKTKPIYNDLVEILLQFIEINNNGIITVPDVVTTSSGSVLILIFKNFVIKIFNNHKSWLKVSTILSKTHYSNYVVKMLHSVSKHDFNAISTEKLIPIVNYNAHGSHLIKEFDHKEVLKLLWNISKALRDVHENEWEQGDCSWDNIGIIGNRYVIFDFNCTRQLQRYHPSSDISQLMRSTLFNLNYVNKIPIEEKTFDFIFKLKNKKFFNGNKFYNFMNFTFNNLKHK